MGQSMLVASPSTIIVHVHIHYIGNNHHPSWGLGLSLDGRARQFVLETQGYQLMMLIPWILASGEGGGTHQKF